MNDTERDLRELFESKARDAGSAPPVTREVLRRGRRRQVATVAIAGVTALAVAAVAVVSLQALHRSDTSVPGGSTGNPAFTATIQNFTISVPKGWTLIDQWPLGVSTVVSVGGGSCTGEPVKAGSGQASANGAGSSGGSSTDCVESRPVPQAIPTGGLPMLTLSNDDPGLAGSVCNAGGSLPALSATLYIGLDYAVTQSADWQSRVPAWPDPLGNVLRNDLPQDQMPCGPGGYAHFQTGGMPYIVWAGFGSDVTDADMQAIIDAFNGMQVSDAEITPPATNVPGYVLTGGTVADSATSGMWSLEASPSSRNVQLSYAEVGGRVGSAGDFTVPDVPIEAAGAGHGVEFGAVTFDADRVELRPTDGTDPLPGSILQLPDSLGASFDAFVAPVGAGGDIVAVGPTGDLGSISLEPSLDDRRAQSDLRNAYVAAKTYFTDSDSFEGFTPAVASSIEPSLDWQADLTTPGKVSIREVGADHILLVTATPANDAFCIAEQPDGSTTYGAIDAQNVAQCVGGEVAWGQDAQPTETPTAVPDATSTVNLEGFPSPTTLTVNGSGGSCLSIEVDMGSSGSGVCPHMSNHAGSFATIVRVGDGTGLPVLVGFTGAKAADRVVLVAADGTRTQAPILYTLDAALDRQYFAFPVEATSGTLHIEDVNGNQLAAPIKVEAS